MALTKELLKNADLNNLSIRIFSSYNDIAKINETCGCLFLLGCNDPSFLLDRLSPIVDKNLNSFAKSR